MRTECKQVRLRISPTISTQSEGADSDGGKITSDAGVLLLREALIAVDRTHFYRTLSGEREES